MNILIPRLPTAHAAERFSEIAEALRGGASPTELVRTDFGSAAPNTTGGQAPTLNDLHRWRTGVMAKMQGVEATDQNSHAIHAKALGRAVAEVISPGRSDAAHDGVWSFLSLMLFPDLVAARWGLRSDEELPLDRWVGAQLGRDRNYLKLSWRNWTLLGDIMESAAPPLGEDEFLALMERTSLARNKRLIRLAALAIIDAGTKPEISSRSDFARRLMTRLTYQTGPLLLDVLSDGDLAQLVDEQCRDTYASYAGNVDLSPRPRRSAEAISLVPQPPESTETEWFELGTSSEDAGEISAALSYYEKAAAGGHPTAMYNLAGLLDEAGRQEEAKVWYAKATSAGETDAAFDLGQLLRKSGELEEAAAWFKKVSEGNPTAKNILGSILHELGDLGGAEDWWTQAANDRHPAATRNLIALLDSRGRHLDAQWWRENSD